MRQHLSTPASNIPLSQKLEALSTDYELNDPLFAADSPAMPSALPKPFTPSSATSSNMTSSQIFKELEKTIHGISEKLSFPSSFTPSRKGHENSYHEDVSCPMRDSEGIYKQASDPLGSMRTNNVENFPTPHVKHVRTPTKRIAWPSESLDYQEIDNSGITNTYLSDFLKTNVSSTASSSQFDEQTNLTLTERVNLGHDFATDSLDRSENHLYHSLWSYHSENQEARDADEVTENSSLKEMHSYYGENNVVSGEGVDKMSDNVSGRSEERFDSPIHFIDDGSKGTPDDEGQELNGFAHIDSHSIASRENYSGEELAVNSEKEHGVKVQQIESSDNEIFVENGNNRSIAESGVKTDETETKKASNVLDVKDKTNGQERMKRIKSSKPQKTTDRTQNTEHNTQRTKNKSQKAADKTPKTEEKGQLQGYQESPTDSENKRVFDVISQLAKMKFDDGKQPKVRDPKAHLRGVQPGYAATQLTALSYLFKELMNLLGEKSEFDFFFMSDLLLLSFIIAIACFVPKIQFEILFQTGCPVGFGIVLLQKTSITAIRRHFRFFTEHLL